METAQHRTAWIALRALAKPRSSSTLLWSAIVLAVLAGFGCFAYTASVIDQFPGEVAAASWVQSWHTSWLDTTMQALSPDHRFVTAPLLAMAVIALIWKGRRMECGLVLGATAVGFVTLTALKALVSRPRPPEELVQVIEQAGGYSFPSGHVTHYVVFLGTLALILSASMRPGLSRWLVQAGVLAVLVAIRLSRIYLGVHWPSDVVGGYVVGAAVVAGAFWVWRRWTGALGPVATPDSAP